MNVSEQEKLEIIEELFEEGASEGDDDKCTQAQELLGLLIKEVRDRRKRPFKDRNLHDLIDDIESMEFTCVAGNLENSASWILLCRKVAGDLIKPKDEWSLHKHRQKVKFFDHSEVKQEMQGYVTELHPAGWEEPLYLVICKLKPYDWIVASAECGLILAHSNAMAITMKKAAKHAHMQPEKEIRERIAKWVAERGIVNDCLYFERKKHDAQIR